MARRYAEQEKIAGFASRDHTQRRAAAQRERDAMLIRRATLKGLDSIRELKKNLAKTEAYLHLTFDERHEALRQIAAAVNTWDDCNIFAECIDKRAFAGAPPPTPPLEAAFDQIVTRFHRYLADQVPAVHGMLVQDRNDTAAERLTNLMRSFHQRGTRWIGQIPLLIETPLFVDSRLTSLVQVADVCSYAFRKYLEEGKTELFDLIFPKGP